MTPRVGDHADVAVEADPDVVRLVRVRLHEGDDPIVKCETSRLVVVDAYLVADS